MALKITLPPELARFVRQKLKGGGYKLARDVLIAGLRLLQNTDRAANLAIGDLNGTGIPEGADIEGLAFVAGDKRQGCRLESNYGSDQCKKPREDVRGRPFRYSNAAPCDADIALHEFANGRDIRQLCLPRPNLLQAPLGFREYYLECGVCEVCQLTIHLMS